MESNGTLIPPNPDTSLAFLPPGLANQLEATRYLSIASLAVFIWDLLSNLPQDYRLLTGDKISPPTVTYFISRFSSLAHILATTVFHIVPVGPGWCHRLPRVIGWCWVVAIPSTSLLFFFRIRAVFDGRPWIIGFFALLWLANLGGSMTVPFALFGGNIPNTNRCIPTSVKPFSSAGIIVTAINDTLVFVAISWRIIMDTALSGKLRSFFRGQSLPYISRELLRGGQQYYLITVGGNIFVMAMLLSPSTPPLLRDMFPVINMTLENSMACRVFRSIKLSRRDSDRTTARSETADTSPPTTKQLPPIPFRSFYGNREGEKPSAYPVVEVKKTVESFRDDGTKASRASNTVTFGEEDHVV
ncbi:hypothetical protein BU17DRAFT_40741 [Hysterangium stoloniferum]|nr:hypothetical protein BU17DRAFT_40741 [Hysterangium stoloniferum]